MEKILITETITPIGIPTEEDLQGEGWKNKIIKVYSAERRISEVSLRDGAPEHFHTACKNLLTSLQGRVNAILVGGSTGEGIGLGPRQWEVLMRAMKEVCPPDIRILAGLFGRDNMINDQIRVAFSLGIREFVLGLNHTSDNQCRFQNAISSFGSNDKLWLYNMPTFEPASLKFTTQCAENSRVSGIMDFSKGSFMDRIHVLLELKESRSDFQVLIGNEAIYPDIPEEDFALVDGLVSVNSNAGPDLLREFTQNPRIEDVAQRRQTLHAEIGSLPSIAGGSPPADIQRHILGLKLYLMNRGIFEPQNVALYDRRGELFQPNTD